MLVTLGNRSGVLNHQSSAPGTLVAAKAGIDHEPPLADSLVYAVAELVSDVVWTQDDDFDGLARVKYFPKRKR